VASGLLLSIVPRELAPTRIRGAFFVMANGPEGGGFDYTVQAAGPGRKVLMAYEGEGKPIRMINTRVPGGFGGGGECRTGKRS